MKFRARWFGALALAAAGAAAAAWMAHGPTMIRMEDTPMGGIFAPDRLTISPGTTVQWRNEGELVHDATDRRDAASRPGDVAYPPEAEPFDSGPMQPGQTFSYTFKVPGTYKYICTPHEFGGMTGEVIVTR